jgi:diaminohydroxyphosphoribosylaminopyrimidine deaminase/5-amino-6-(5-phosphoribosylamino)uracil reductase
MVESCKGDVLIVTTSAAPADRRRALEAGGVRIMVFDGVHGRTDFALLVAALAKEQYQSLIVEGGSKVNWAILESGIADKIFFYYAPKILGGVQSLPVAGGTGRLRRSDALKLRNVTLHRIPPDEFAVEAWLEKP